MNVIELCEKGKEETVLYKCGNCNTYYTDKTIAENCCKSVFCSVCGKELSQDRTKNRDFYYVNPIMCCDCKEKERLSKYEVWTEQEYINKNKQENNKYEAVFVGDHYYSDLYDAIQSLWEDGLTKEEIEQQVFQVGEETKLDKIDINTELGNICENSGLEDYDMETMFVDLPELYDFIDKWNAKQNCTYFIGQSIRVVPSKETLDEYCEE